MPTVASLRCESASVMSAMRWWKGYCISTTRLLGAGRQCSHKSIEHNVLTAHHVPHTLHAYFHVGLQYLIEEIRLASGISVRNSTFNRRGQMQQYCSECTFRSSSNAVSAHSDVLTQLQLNSCRTSASTSDNNPCLCSISWSG